MQSPQQLTMHYVYAGCVSNFFRHLGFWKSMQIEVKIQKIEIMYVLVFMVVKL